MVVNERKLTLNSCGRCETRWWQADERNVAFGTVLDSARRPLEVAV
jgi:hypothetical protein